MADGQTIGRITDVILDGRVRRVAGFSVACADGERFLPLAAVAAVGPSGIEVESPLHLVDEIDFYRRDGVGLSTVLGRSQSGGRVEDVIARLDTGEIEALVLDSGARVAP